MLHAVRAYQTRTFSGRRRAYVIAPSQPAPPNPPGSEYGTLDQKTIKAIIETWLSL